MLDSVFHERERRSRQARAAGRFRSQKVGPKLVRWQKSWIQFRRDFQQRRQQAEIAGTTVMPFPEILHRARPVNVGQQTGVAEAHPPQHPGRAHIKRFLRYRSPPQVVDGIERCHCAGHGKQQYSDRHQVRASPGTHFRFRRWKISTAPEMAIAEYSSAYTLLYRIRRPGTASPCATWLITFKAE